MRQSACLVFNSIMFDCYAAFFKYAGGSSIRLYDGPVITLFILVGWAGASCLLLGPSGFNGCISFAPDFSKLLGAQGSPSSGSLLSL